MELQQEQQTPAAESRLPLMRRSTQTFWQEGRRVPGYSVFDWLHGYIYTRWPYFYIGNASGNRWLGRTLGRILAPFWQNQELSGVENGAGPNVTAAGAAFADAYHGKVVTLESARRLISINQPIELRNLEHVIPFSRARDIVLQNPDHIAVLECPCRVSRANPCYPLDVCLIVGQPFVDFVLEHHPARARRISQTEAADILQAEHERGHVHHAFFKDAMLGRFYAICNCCACCCGAMQGWRNGVPMLASSGYGCRIDASRCVACGTCEANCQFGAISVNGTVSVNAELCMGCGVCVSKCEQEALSLERDASRGEPLEIEELLAAVSR